MNAPLYNEYILIKKKEIVLRRGEGEEGEQRG
jgi:hypothetical protein